ncbi:hypothetical protein BS17DRAFT_787339 [Gyrodon lividus]|nr:hypothetical protein BS17DRAFT_787339 [Gyrodon lividus]
MDGTSAAASALNVLQVTEGVKNALGQHLTSVQGGGASREKFLDQITSFSTAPKIVDSVVRDSLPSSRSPE